MELFKIFGTVGLKGVDSAERELNDLTNTAEQSSNKFSKFGSIMSGIGKGVLVATGAVVTGAIGLVKSVSGAYGQLQQSIGGIETLFGESANKVIENANNAFTTAGISANDYMQQVTSFSASLLQSLGGDTEKACESADMAIRDMADNANKMGTSMEMIQNAYQGFSKQNYTMLDNLKLGYGGTKTEMERLLKDAEKITGIKYDISNLNDVYQAIHVIQQELGITGTTAKEAGETITGSFNSLSASWQNFLAGLGNPDADMKQLVDNLAKGISGAVNNVIPVINNMVAVLPTVMDAIINAVSSMLPTLIETFTSLITKVIDAVVQLLPQFIPLAVDCVLTVTQALLENLPLIVNAGMQLLLGLAQGISQALPGLMPIIMNVIQEIVLLLINNMPLIIEIGTQLLIALINGLAGALPLLVDMIPTIVQTFIRVLIDNMPLIMNCGVQLVSALVSGIFKAIPNLLGVGENVVDGIYTGIRNSFSKITNFFATAFSNIKKAFNPSNWFGGSSKFGVELYAEGGIMTRPTLFGVNPATGNAMVGGEAGAEAIAPISTLQQYVSSAVKSETSEMAYSMNRMYELLVAYLPSIRENMDRPLVFDTGAMVNNTVDKMDYALGDRASRKSRFGV